MLQVRAIPCLLLKDKGLVKTVQFKNAKYVGDPINTVRIFNEKEVDELIFLDIQATPNNKSPDFKLLAEIADECFMPLGYGGGVRNLEDVNTIFSIGLEKVAINSYAFENPKFVTQVAEKYGAQSIIGAIDVKKNFWGKYELISHSGAKKHSQSPIEWAKQLEKLGAGELMITSVDREGTWSGYDVALIKSITDVVNIPVIANGGAGNIADLEKAVKDGGSSAVAMGSMVVYQKKDFGVLINFPDRKELDKVFS